MAITSQSLGMLLPSMMFDIIWIFRLMDATNVRVQAGLSGNVNVPAPTNGVYIEKKAADTQYFGTSMRGSGETRTAALATVDTNWTKLRIRRIDASTFGFTVNDGTELTLAPALQPTATVWPFISVETQVAAIRTYHLDYFWMKVAGLVR